MSAVNFDMEHFNDQVKVGKNKAVVEFWAPWCGYCRRIGPAFDKIAEERTDLTVGKVNIDEFPQLAEAYGIDVIPTLLVFKDGKDVASVVAPKSKSEIDTFIDENIGG